MSTQFYIQVVIAIVLTILVTLGIFYEPLVVEWEDKQMKKIKKAFIKK